MREEVTPVAVLASDIHLSHRRPKCRQDDWYGAMASHLKELGDAATDYSNWELPIIIAGDIFDHWDAPPELIEFAIRHLPKCYAVPGQHDLPNHDYGQIRRSAYGALMAAGVIQNLEPGRCVASISNVGFTVNMCGCPWGADIADNSSRGKHQITIAVVHAYIWDRKRNSYDGAPEDKSLGHYLPKLANYDAAVFGDNHRGFLAKRDESWPEGRLQSVLNCGGFMRRKSNDEWAPKIGILYSDGSIKRATLQAAESDEICEESKPRISGGVDLQFLSEYASADHVNFAESVRLLADSGELSKGGAAALLRIYENVQGQS
jgi:hypothetical protein